MTSYLSKSVVLCLMLLQLPAPILADEKNAQDWSLEDLLEIRVYSVHKSESDFFTTPAAVTVITRNDIEKSSAQNISDLLVAVPGLYTFQHQSNLSSVGIRDDAQVFVSTSLVLLDGTPIYSVITGGPEFHSLGLALEDIERIEVIRGSGGNSWGANASSGVINIITRSAEDVQSSQLSLSVSSRSESSAILQQGFSSGSIYGYISLGYEKDPGFDNDAGNESDHHREFIRLRGDFENNSWRVLSSFSAVSTEKLDENFYSHSAGDHDNTENTKRDLQLFLFQAQYLFINADVATIQVSFVKDFAERRFLPADYDLFQSDTELRYQRHWQENNITHFTLNYRHYDISIEDLTPTLYGFDPNKKKIDLSALGFNHISQLPYNTTLEFGGRVEDYSILDAPLYSPAGRLAYEASDSLYFWSSYTRSYQFPNYVQYANYLIINSGPPPLYLRGSTSLDAETNDDYGFGVRWKDNNDLIDFTLFYKETEGQIRSDSSKISLVVGPPDSLTLPYTNTIDVVSRGWECSWTHYFNESHVSQLDLTYFTSTAKISEASDSPRSYSFVPDYKASWTHQFSITDNIEFKGSLTWYDRYVSENINGIFADPNWIAAHFRFDANVKYLMSNIITLDFGVKNLFNKDREAIYPISTQHPEKVEPSFHITLRIDT